MFEGEVLKGLAIVSVVIYLVIGAVLVYYEVEMGKIEREKGLNKPPLSLIDRAILTVVWLPVLFYLFVTRPKNY